MLCRIMEHAERINEFRGDFGEEATEKLFARCETTLKSALSGNEDCKAYQDVLGTFAAGLSEEVYSCPTSHAVHLFGASDSVKDIF